MVKNNIPYIIAGIFAIGFVFIVLTFAGVFKEEQKTSCQFKITTNSDSICPDCVIWEDWLEDYEDYEIYKRVLQEGNIVKIETICEVVK